MTHGVFSICRVDWRVHEKHLRTVRETVFVRELGIRRELEWDGLDTMCLHALASAGRQAIGCHVSAPLCRRLP
jgi:hypothetical protein